VHKREHWENVYLTKGRDEMSWSRERLETSLEMISKTGIANDAAVIDIGGGNSTLVDDLIGLGFDDLTVLDISKTAIQTSRERLGTAATKVEWIEADVTDVEFPADRFDLWHDRAVFHFLTDSEDRRKYIELVRRSMKPDGNVIIASFSLDGPMKCSGLDVVRYSSDSMLAEFEGFRLIDCVRETHTTPFGTTQDFIYSHLRKA